MHSMIEALAIGDDCRRLLYFQHVWLICKAYMRDYRIRSILGTSSNKCIPIHVHVYSETPRNKNTLGFSVFQILEDVF